MNTLFALYFWLMQVLGVPMFGPDVDVNAGNNGVTVRADRAANVLPPPEEEGSTYVVEGRSRTFISNGF